MVTALRASAKPRLIVFGILLLNLLVPASASSGLKWALCEGETGLEPCCVTCWILCDCG
jgi:hypothetical protein